MDMSMSEGHTGSILQGIGHMLAGSFFFGFGVSFLLLSLKRARALGPHESFCEASVPEKNPVVLKRTAWALHVAFAAGMAYEGGGGALFAEGFFFQLMHETLYGSFGFVGLVTYLEAKRRVPPDSGRASLVVALVLVYVMMSSHAKMKTIFIEKSVHLILSYIWLVHAVVIAYSVGNPKSVIAYLLGWTLLVVEGAWLATVGLVACCVDVRTRLVETYFSIQVLTIFSIVILVGAFALPPRKEDGLPHTSGNLKHEYTSLVVKEHEEKPKTTMAT